eukprot:scaffold9245_cov78-Phaeocystis_antarctica.AAC.1
MIGSAAHICNPRLQDSQRSGWTRGSSPRSIYSGPRGLSESTSSGINLQSHRREKDTSVPWSACTRGKTAEPALGRLRTTKSSVSRTSASTARSRTGDYRSMSSSCGGAARGKALDCQRGKAESRTRTLIEADMADAGGHTGFERLEKPQP